MRLSTGINGFGRFGLHLLKYWLDRNKEANFSIDFINDDTLEISKILEIINTDKAVVFNKYKVQANSEDLIILEPDGSRHTIRVTRADRESIPWVGEPDLFLECSGKNTVSRNCLPFLTKKTKHVLISATSWDADKTLVYGFNQMQFSPDQDRIVSYGSCTVNAYVPLANYLNEKYGILNSDVNVVHNIQEYRLKENQTLIRKFCTLEKSAPTLLGFLDPKDFIVNYTVTPYTGVSIIDFRFEFKKDVDRDTFVEDLVHSIKEGELKGLYGMDEVDIGPEIHTCTTFSSVFIKEGIRKVGDSLYLQAYFDTENSVNRYYDLVNHISDPGRRESALN